MKKPTSICIFGDSISWGAWDLEKAGWVNRLWVDIGVRDDDYVEIYNCSISGATSDIILKNFENEALIRSADALIFQVGSNDSAYEIQLKNSLISVYNFKRNIEEVIKKAKRITNKIIFLI